MRLLSWLEGTQFCRLHYGGSRGNDAKVLARLESEHGIRREILLRRVQHLTRGVIFGSREFIDGWFERNRAWFKESSAEKRKTGARPVSKDWKGLYNLRTLSP